jgi:hypothetical protein
VSYARGSFALSLFDEGTAGSWNDLKSLRVCVEPSSPLDDSEEDGEDDNAGAGECAVAWLGVFDRRAVFREEVLDDSFLDCGVVRPTFFND